MKFDCDLLILGAGSAAFAAALRARELGKTAVMIEERTVGGTCANRGCLPSKNLIEAAKLIHQARHPRYPGLNSRAMDIDFQALIEQKDQIVRDYRHKKYQSLVDDRIRIEIGHAEFIDAHTVSVDGRRLTGQHVLLATGSSPVAPDILGLNTRRQPRWSHRGTQRTIGRGAAPRRSPCCAARNLH